MLQDIIVYFLLGFFVSKCVLTFLALYIQHTQKTILHMLKIALLFSFSGAAGIAIGASLDKLVFHGNIMGILIISIRCLIPAVVASIFDIAASHWTGYKLFERHTFLKLILLNFASLITILVLLLRGI